MKLIAALISMGVFGLWALAIAISVYGLYLGFSASIILGVVMLLVEPSPFIFGLVELFFHKNLAQEIVNWLSR